MSNHSVIEHRANYHFIKIEEDYIHICSSGDQYPQCKATILSVLEHWMNDKRGKGQSEYVYMTYPEWIDAMYGLFRRSTIIACLTDLERDKFILRRPTKRHGKDTYEYSLNVGVVQAKLKQLPERIEKNCRPNLNASKFKRVQKQTDTNLDGSTDTNLDGTSDNPSKNRHNIDSLTEIPSSTDSEDVSSDEDTPTRAELLHDIQETYPEVKQEVQRITDSQLKAVSGSHAAIGNDEEQPTVKMPVVTANKPPRETGNLSRDRQLPPGVASMETAVTPGQQAPLSPASLPSAVTPPGDRHGDTGREEAQPSHSPEPAQILSPPPATGSGTSAGSPAQASGRRPPRRPQGKQVVVGLSLLGSDVKRWIEEIRGGTLRMTQGNVKACNALAECDGVSKESLGAYFEYVEEQKWTVDLLTAAGETGNERLGFLSFESNWPKLKRKMNGNTKKPAREPGTSDFDIYKGNGVEEREQALRDYEERKANGTLIWQ